MAFDPNTQERIYRGLKTEYLAGLYAVGARLDIQKIADRYRASPTPVREAIHRMIGEQLFEGNPEGGIRVVLPSPEALADLYAWNAQQLLGALRIVTSAALRTNLRKFAGRAVSDGTQVVMRTAEIFQAIVATTGNSEFIAQIERCNERLRYVRLAELRSLPDRDAELSRFVRNGQIDMRSNLRREISAYHRLRIQKVNVIMNSAIEAADTVQST